MRIIKRLADDIYEIQLDEQDMGKKYGGPYISENRLILAHDYVEIEGYTTIYANSDVNMKTDFNNALNCTFVKTSVQVPIRAFQQVVLPLLNNSEYLQDEHFDIIPGVDGNPDYMRYDWMNETIFYHKDGVAMAAFKPKGERIFSHVTRKVYEIIKASMADTYQKELSKSTI